MLRFTPLLLNGERNKCCFSVEFEGLEDEAAFVTMADDVSTRVFKCIELHLTSSVFQKQCLPSIEIASLLGYFI